MASRTWSRGLVAALLLVVATACSGPPAGTGSPAPNFVTELDHATYPDVSSLTGAADAVLTGQVIANSNDPGVSPGTAEDGSPIPGIPQTRSTVKVLTASKGTSAAGQEVIVSVPGGVRADGIRNEVVSSTSLRVGAEYLFFLLGGPREYSPLAGGAAAGARQPSGTYLFPGEVTGAEPVVVRPEELSAPLTVSLRQLVVDTRLASAGVTGTGNLRIPAGARTSCRDDVTVTLNGSVISVRLPGSKFVTAGTQCLYRGAPGEPTSLFSYDPRTTIFQIVLRRPVITSRVSSPIRLDLSVGTMKGGATVAARNLNGVLSFP